MSEVEFLVKVRDGLQMVVDAVSEYLEKKSPVNKKWDPDKIEWKAAEGTKGPYEKADPQATPDFKAMLQDLKDHDGKMNRKGYFYWVFTDKATVGRKKRKKKES